MMFRYWEKVIPEIFLKNLENNQKGILMSGEDEFKIKSLNNNILKYDDKEIMINF